MSGFIAVSGLSCPMACEILVPRPGIEPVSPVLQTGVLTTGPLGKSLLAAVNCPLIAH